MYKFKVGDRVRPNIDFAKIYNRADIGTVVEVMEPDCIWVKHDVYDISMHSLDGMCEDGYGWFYNAIMLELAEIKLVDTRLARKVYKNKIVKEEEGFIYVQG